MWIKILQLFCFFPIFAMGNEINGPVILHKAIFRDAPFNGTSSKDCVGKTSGDILNFECESLENVKFRIKGTFRLNAEMVTMLYCLRESKSLLPDKKCTTSDEVYESRLLNCCTERNIHELEIRNDEYLRDSYLNYFALNYPNISDIHWNEKYDCHHLNQFTERFQYLKKLNVSFGNEIPCKDFYFSNLTQVKELRLEFGLNKYVNSLNKKLFSGMVNLEVLQLNITTEEHQISIPTELFQGLSKLSSIRFIHCDILNLSDDHFQGLINLRSLAFIVKKSDSFPGKWLGFPTIRYKLFFLETNFQFEPFVATLIGLKAFTCQDSNDCIFSTDINNKLCPQRCDCSLKRSDMRFIIDCRLTEIGEEIPELPIPITGSTCLYFTNKSLTQLPNSAFYGYSNVTELHLANNKLANITVEQLPQNLTYLDLRNNSIQYLDHKVIEFLSNRAGKISMNLSENPWKCNCNTRETFKFISDFSNRIDDREFIKYDQEYLKLWKFVLNMGFCNPIVYITFGCLLGLSFIIIIYFYTKKSIIMWLYERNLCLKWISIPEPKTDVNLKIDAFLAFSHKDLELVEEYVEKLEKGPRAHQLCFYQRDWLIGESIPKCILTSIEVSKRIIILMTNNFVNSSWGLFELRSAIRVTSMDKSKRLIIILYPEVDLEKLDSELKMYMKYNTYLRRDDPFFWRKLMFSMPHKQIHREQPSLREAQTIEETQL